MYSMMDFHGYHDARVIVLDLMEQFPETEPHLEGVLNYLTKQFYKEYDSLNGREEL